MNELNIEVTYDFICPWCWIGGEKLKQAISEANAGGQTKLVFVPYELNPDMPVEGRDRKEYRSAKFGSWARSQIMDAQVTAAGRQAGLEFNYALAKRTPNTLAAHRLVWVLQQRHDVAALVEAIFHAYFSAGRDIGDIAVLTEIAVEAGFDKDEIETFFASGGGVGEVRALEARAIAQGVSSVPSVKIGDEVVSGAQSVALFRATLENALKAGTTAP
ncbi:disulfide bond formation protein DsbA [Paraburkholderia ginsengiterrae]|uniref:Disulfide bond formation protein DsbA n=1 Tax=Paraburkholderia ginsengiterrae TaxID=1462993 RepID=A0A1A9N7X8_9BURK|nr:DsbA family oxidoreductase [Paraburkholderia ginsengiterrae]OAJ54945.1 disulfide bond formation protein DsbA [Paraburkholderia ginsengiterrae]OAJ61129.1 disulfide bond formation protein DsbA [Paraburkholderia ginsengiterrae]